MSYSIQKPMQKMFHSEKADGGEFGINRNIIFIKHFVVVEII